MSGTLETALNLQSNLTVAKMYSIDHQHSPTNLEGFTQLSPNSIILIYCIWKIFIGGKQSNKNLIKKIIIEKKKEE